MVDILIALLPIFLIIVSGVVKERYSKEGKKKKKQEELDEAFAKNDRDSIANQLDLYYRMLREKSNNSARQQKDH